MNMYNKIPDAETLLMSKWFNFVNQLLEISSVLFEAFWQMLYK